MMSLTFGLFTQVSGSGPLGPLVLDSFQLSVLVYIRYICFVFSLFTCICIVYICYTFWKSYLVLIFFKHTNLVNINYISLDCFSI